MKNNRFSISIRHALMLLVLLLGFPSFGEAEDEFATVYEGGIAYRINLTQGCAVCYGLFNDYRSIVISSSIYFKGYKKYYPVTSINDRAFKGFSTLTSINIPESVTSIGASAFEGCSGLTSITIPESVTSIGGSAFRLSIYNHRTTKTNQKYPSVNL